MQQHVNIVVYNAKQCDPRKCSAAKLRRFGLVREVLQMKFLPKRAVVLNPFAEVAFSPADRERIENCGLVALDCSWEHAEKVLLKHVRGTSRCLPILIAGNPVNFGKATKLSTVEAGRSLAHCRIRTSSIRNTFNLQMGTHFSRLEPRLACKLQEGQGQHRHRGASRTLLQQMKVK